MIKYINMKSIIHQINPIIKYLFEFVVILMIPFMDVRSYLLVFVVLLTTVLLSKIGLFYFHKKLSFVLYILITLLVISALVPGFSILSALLISFRIYLMFGIIFIVVMTTRLSSLIKFFNVVFSKFLSKNNTRKLTFITLLIIKFIPLLILEVDHLMLSFNTRGMYLNQGSISTRIAFIRCFMLSFIEKIESLIDEFDLVIHAKNIGLDNMDYIDGSQKFKFIDFVVIFVMIMILVI